MAQSSDPSWIADIPRSNLVGLRRPVVTARASDTHGPTATLNGGYEANKEAREKYLAKWHPAQRPRGH